MSLLVAWAVPGNAYCAGLTVYFIGLGLHDGGGDETAPSDSAAITASAGVGSARSRLHRVAIQIGRQFESSPDYLEATRANLQAFMAYQFERESATAAVRLSPAGVGLEIEIDRLEHQLDDARQEAKLAGADHSDKIATLAAALLTKRTELSQREAKALAADEKFTNARYAWLDANARLTALEDDFAQQVHTDPQWRTAKNQLEQARTALASVSR